MIRRGAHFLIALFASVVILTSFSRPLSAATDDFTEDKAEVQPAIMIKLLAPISIKPYPLVSVLQYFRGKIGKSTANIAIVVNM